MAFAVRDALGEDGRAIWMRWSATSPKYDERVAAQTWARVKPGPITAASLFGLAMKAGYRRNRDDALPPRRARPDSAKAEREAQHRQQRADDAATRAQAMLKQAEWAEHPYLQRKALGTRRVSGYRNDGPKGFVLDDALLIPMRSLRTGEVRAVQAIQPDGSRKFLPFGAAPRSASTPSARVAASAGGWKGSPPGSPCVRRSMPSTGRLTAWSAASHRASLRSCRSSSAS